MIVGESIDEMAAALGLRKRSPLLQREQWLGSWILSEALRERVGLLAGLSTDALENIAESIVFSAWCSISSRDDAPKRCALGIGFWRF